MTATTDNSPSPASSAGDCFHCGLPVASGSQYSVHIDGAERAMCCPGCEAVAGAIVAGGLDNFYRYRERSNERPDGESVNDRWGAYDLPEVQAAFVRDADGHNEGAGHRIASLLVGGITCAACVWLIEKHLAQLAGVLKVSVNASTQRAQVLFSPESIKVSELFAALAEVGYRPAAATAANSEQLIQQERRAAMRRLGVAGLGTMQVMMFAIALYFGASKGIEAQFEQFFRWVSLIVATPVVCYAAQPFFAAALRALRSRHLTMDVPVSLAIGLAYGASVYATVFGTGEVYFESVSMFTFFLLLGRAVEMRARHRAGLASGGLAQLLPLAALRLRGQGGEASSAGDAEVESVPVGALCVGDHILLRPGDTVPADGEVVDGESGVDESLLSGESALQQKSVGSQVFAGSVNGDSSLVVTVTASGGNTRLSAIERLVESAQLEKPTQVAFADRIAGRFVAVVLFVSVAAFAFWWQRSPEDAFWVALSVLVVTCPCALSLATPAALAAATLRLQELGLLVARGHVLEALPNITRVVFDKTGTLTEGEPRLQQIQLMRDGVSEDRARDLAAALEARNSHPLARAFRPWFGNLRASALRAVTGRGVEGEIDGISYRLGREDFVLELAAGETVERGAVAQPQERGQWLLLADTGGAIAWLGLGDAVRDSASAAVADLQVQGLDAELLSGDQSSEVARLAALTGIQRHTSGAAPEQKLAQVQEAQSRGERLMMVGDGINDVPVLSGADVSVAMMTAADLAQSRADAILLQGDLQALPRAFALARKCRTIIRQNLGWAILYNLLALPLAFMGLVPPWAAAVGMSMSSLIVVVNALRLSRWQPVATDKSDPAPSTATA
ncbi:heavy metal translocating P-type ATPase [Microbulbifer aggregans]|uniref:heavy metal translocating P-type ATPase n=1 Tax=Microbulbifer aggregans TaxID=1769779 RepID=UPI001CFC974B|nr:heavy metal translocating P-type ATPase [Microbulbifer aggregans]